jgi:hypothetical protein
VREALVKHDSGKADRSFDLWKMLSVSAWWRLFIDGNGEAPRDVVTVEGVLAGQP